MWILIYPSPYTHFIFQVAYSNKYFIIVGCIEISCRLIANCRNSTYDAELQNSFSSENAKTDFNIPK